MGEKNVLFVTITRNEEQIDLNKMTGYYEEKNKNNWEKKYNILERGGFIIVGFDKSHLICIITKIEKYQKIYFDIKEKYEKFKKGDLLRIDALKPEFFSVLKAHYKPFVGQVLIDNVIKEIKNSKYINFLQ